MAAETRTTSSTGGQKGVKLERHDLVPIGPLRELATHFGLGAQKYDNHQWRQGYEWSKSYSALERHLKLFWQGLDFDVCSNERDNCAIKTADGLVVPIDYANAMDVWDGDVLAQIHINGEVYQPGLGTVSGDTCYNHLGSHHMVAVMWHSAVLLEFKDRFPEFDDRYKPSTVADELAEKLKEAALYPDPKLEEVARG